MGASPQSFLPKEQNHWGLRKSRDKNPSVLRGEAGNYLESRSPWLRVRQPCRECPTSVTQGHRACPRWKLDQDDRESPLSPPQTIQWTGTQQQAPPGMGESKPPQRDAPQRRLTEVGGTTTLRKLFHIQCKATLNETQLLGLWVTSFLPWTRCLAFTQKITRHTKCKEIKDKKQTRSRDKAMSRIQFR